MSHLVDPEEVHSSESIQQKVEGNQSQVIGEAIDSTIYHISDAEYVTINSHQNLPSLAKSIKSQPLIRRSPYLGLRKFEIRGKDLFFGRGQLIERLRQDQEYEIQNILLYHCCFI